MRSPGWWPSGEPGTGEHRSEAAIEGVPMLTATTMTVPAFTTMAAAAASAFIAHSPRRQTQKSSS